MLQIVEKKKKIAPELCQEAKKPKCISFFNHPLS